MNLSNLTLVEAKKLIDNGDLKPAELTEYYLKHISSKNPYINAFITINENAFSEAEKAPKTKKLSGLPIAVKDAFSTKSLRTTAASKIIDNYKPVYESTVTSKIISEGAVILGKTNLDQFCHGSSTETSAYGATKNPWDTSRIPGGSSGGSAAAVAGDMCSASLGTETAGSIRLPASWCGTVGLKPTYGRVSRYGILAMGSSLDCPGPITKSVEDAALMLSVIAGYDQNDNTTVNNPVEDYLSKLDPSIIKGMKFGLPKEYMDLELEAGIRKNTLETIELIKSLGGQIIEVEMMDPAYAIAVYTIVCRSEVSSNLSRYDGTRYCVPDELKEQIAEYYETVRGKGFGSEAKRRIMTGTFSLSSGYADEYFKQAEKVRALIRDDVLNILKNVDLIIGPTTATIAPKLGLSEQNPLFGEMADVLAETSSLTGLPGISIPNGLSEGLPTGFQIFGRHFDELNILNVAKALEDSIAFKPLSN